MLVSSPPSVWGWALFLSSCFCTTKHQLSISDIWLSNTHRAARMEPTRLLCGLLSCQSILCAVVLLYYKIVSACPNRDYVTVVQWSGQTRKHKPTILQCKTGCPTLFTSFIIIRLPILPSPRQQQPVTQCRVLSFPCKPLPLHCSVHYATVQRFRDSSSAGKVITTSTIVRTIVWATHKNIHTLHLFQQKAHCSAVKMIPHNILNTHSTPTNEQLFPANGRKKLNPRTLQQLPTHKPTDTVAIEFWFAFSHRNWIIVSGWPLRRLTTTTESFQSKQQQFQT